MKSFGRIVAAAVFLAVFIAAGSAHAQYNLLTNMLSGQREWLTVGVVEGRITLRCTRMVHMNTASNISNTTKESFQLRPENGQPRLNYERSAPDETFKVDISGAGDNVKIDRIPAANSKVEPLEFRQLPGQDVTLAFGAGAERREYRAADLWHMLVVCPKECRERLVPLLELMRPETKFAELAASIETKVLEQAGDGMTGQRQRWAELVKQLGDERFARREAADRGLRAGGPAVAGYLRRLDPARLDAEQRFRIRRILAALQDESEDDSIDAAAAMLSTDPAVWLALLGRTEVETRKTAARQLTAILGEPIGVDPAAEPDTQREARDRLQSRIERK